MNPTSNVTSEDFSPCSISDICGSFPNIGYCLQCKYSLNTHTEYLIFIYLYVHIFINMFEK